MADKKISQLSSASTPLAGTEVLPIVQSSTTVKVSVADLTAGRAISATQVTASTGNFIVGTAGKGIDFSANTNAAGMTSELLTWYEEGTWTPAFTCAVVGNLNVVLSAQVGRYTRVGRVVTVSFLLATSTFTHSTASGYVSITGLPFTSNATANVVNFGSVAFQGIQKANYTQVTCQVANNTTSIFLPISAPASNQNFEFVAITDMPSGSIVLLRGALSYIV